MATTGPDNDTNTSNPWLTVATLLILASAAFIFVTSQLMY